MKKKNNNSSRNHLAFRAIQRLSTFFILCVVGISSVIAQIPSGYYNGTSNLSGSSLKAELHDIIKGHITYPYTSSSTDVWDILKVADRDPNNPTKVIGIYSGFSMDAAAEYNSGNGWSREHVWSQSRGDFSTSQGVGTDLHHIRAEDVSTNSARNNRNFDIASSYYIDQSGNYSGATLSKTSSSQWVWEPRDEVKGDIARMIFYVATRYEGDNGELDLELTETLLTNTDQSPIHARLSTLLTWHENDPVSQAERDRNDIVYSYQNNRNPFIDHPEFVCLIYGCSTTPPSGSNSTELFISEYIEGSSYNKAIEIANFTGSAVNLSNYSIRKQTNGAGGWSNLTLSGSLADGDVYVVCHSSASSAITSVADLTTSSASLTFNGNDPVALFKGGTLIDIVGTYNGGTGNFAKDVTLVRKSSVDSPNTTYTISEWNFESTNNFNFIGSHVFGASRSMLAGVEENALFQEKLKAYPNPAHDILHFNRAQGIVDVRIVDLQGRNQNVSVDVTSTTLDISLLSTGVYVLIIQTEEAVESIQFVKQ